MFSRTTNQLMSKVAVLGGAGGIGQPLSLLMKQCPLVGHLTVYDIQGARGVAADLSHISTTAEVVGYDKEDIGKALADRDIVIIPAGVPRKPGMTRDDLFNTNAGIVKALTQECAAHCPNASILIISNPVNSTVPIAAEVLKAAGVFNPQKLFGVTTLDVVRARQFVAQKKGLNVNDIDVNVIGGHSGPTIVPLLSQVFGVSFDAEETAELTKRIQYGGDEVVQAKDGAGSATLSMAYAGAEFAVSLMKAYRGDENISQCAYVEHTEMPWFSTRLSLGKDGVDEILPIGPISEYEEGLLQDCKAELEKNIQKGIDFANA